MSEAPWQKHHREIMELEEKKNHLLSENEALESRKRELVATLADLQKKNFVHSGDLREITALRVKETDELDEKLIMLKMDNENYAENNLVLSVTMNNLQNAIQKAEEENLKLQNDKETLEKDMEILNKRFDTFKLIKQDEENEKRETLANLNTEMSFAKEELRKTSKESQEKKTEIERETRLLAIKRSDLEIYEMRMRKKYPHEVFVLKP